MYVSCNNAIIEAVKKFWRLWGGIISPLSHPVYAGLRKQESQEPFAWLR